jgi:hypothetical protein
MEQDNLKMVNNCWNTSIYFNLETFNGENSNLNLNIVHFLNTRVIWTFVAA